MAGVGRDGLPEPQAPAFPGAGWRCCRSTGKRTQGSITSPTSGWPTTPSRSAGQERRPAIRSWWHEEEARKGSDPGRDESDAPLADRSCGRGRDQRRCRHAHSRSDGRQPTERGVGHTGSGVARQIVGWHVDRIPPYQSVGQIQARDVARNLPVWPGAPGVCWPTLAVCHRVGPRSGAIGPEFCRPADCGHGNGDLIHQWRPAVAACPMSASTRRSGCRAADTPHPGRWHSFWQRETAMRPQRSR